MCKICQAFKPISISLSPNTEWDDVWLALKLIFMPWLWKRGKAVLEMEEEFKKYLGVKQAVSFNSGRTGLLAILTALGLEPGSEVLLQAFTCNAAVNPILWSGLKPIYVDCDENNFNIDIEDLKRKISPNSRVLMVQHTFGLPANMDEILSLVERYNLILIEDCAHSLGAEYYNQKVGTFGKAAFFSFSRDKVISSVYGGIIVTNDDNLAKKIKDFQEKVGSPSYFWIFQQLLHPILLNFLILPIYNFLDLGKMFLVLSQVLHILSKAVHWKEKRGEKPNYFPKQLPNALALLVLNQFRKLEKFNQHRKKIADFYYENLKNSSFILPKKDNSIFLRFTAKHPKAHQIIFEAWHKENILIGDWYTSAIAPYDTKLDKVKYKLGSCPKAENLAKKTLNLPTHINISQKDAKKIVKFLNIWK
ncbi:MAG: hypothetical protein COT32_02200 [Candidatus Nealsonbacteria bacterium CG08_land_8_20_14_0_20_36_22]|uniref:DegT/DnrJ/EryC1/StrS aminotransferase n=1 Tax=Candidatus Nealsonbacteria bacterium CG08_land_8_20_14_0_20_36_22 TaxID=1974704 RepID=A0A2H0YQF7_9BACT|nr:MAG: hypothetical protein COT32_02200 [Candidatus Nealsonbacteria bacterium CG08_land_8_20_14_0_20_36_22]